MSRELARLTEWAWTQGLLDGECALITFSANYFQFLNKRYESCEKTLCLKSQKEVALKEIFNDTCHYLRLLKYGGTKPESRHPQRIEWLRTEPTVVDFKSFLNV